MSILIIQILNSLFYASVLFLIAAGLSLIFGVMRHVDDAHDPENQAETGRDQKQN